MLRQLPRFARGSLNAQWHPRVETSAGEEVGGEPTGPASLAVAETFQNPPNAVLDRLSVLGKGSHDGWVWPEMVSWRTWFKRVPPALLLRERVR